MLQWRLGASCVPRRLWRSTPDVVLARAVDARRGSARTHPRPTRGARWRRWRWARARRRSPRARPRARPRRGSRGARGAPSRASASAARPIAAVTRAATAAGGSTPDGRTLLLDPGAPGLRMKALALAARQSFEDAERCARGDRRRRRRSRARATRRRSRRSRGLGTDRSTRPRRETRAAQRLGHGAGLRSAVVVEGNVRVSLPASLEVPVGLAVTSQENEASRHP